MNDTPLNQDFDLYIWEGSSDLAARVMRCLADFDINLIRADAEPELLPARDTGRTAIAIVSASVMTDPRFRGQDWLRAQAIPVIWVAAHDRAQDPRFFPPAYSNTLPLQFNATDLRALLFRLAGIAQATLRPAPARPLPLVTGSPIMQSVIDEARMYAACDNNVLVHGATGVGKERIARLLHDASHRAAGPFIAVNCGAIPDGLFEAHFFGHAKGAFTGAAGSHKGYFEQAHGGTLFLDEIGDLPLHQQVKLLRVLEQNTVTRLGATQEIIVDFRLVSATHVDLPAQVATGRFREDLYYRLAVIELDIPDLDARGPAEKVLLFRTLVRHILENADEPPAWLTERIANMAFPGNVRQLANLAERISLVRRLCGLWDDDRLERALRQAMQATAPSRTPLRLSQIASTSMPGLSEADVIERERILQALVQHGWRRQATADTLGISRKSLWERMRRLMIEDKETEDRETVDSPAESE
ncbi:MAG: sigma-54 dependent transcriptional regulator [Corticimicrobacter sp.]|uniref:sigma-54 dependent transcriptional regulator n=1 Tax=Corticimicrobacter sp. TaxID=2678536 RepID=UPI0032DAE3FA